MTSRKAPAILAETSLTRFRQFSKGGVISGDNCIAL
jgi:hypothetical protein